MTQKMGDERSWTIANFLLGRAYWSADKLQEAVTFLAKGKAKAEELGDSDMLAQSASFLGIYYFIKGLHNKALPYLEIAVELAEETGKYPMSFESPILLAYCDVDRGDFHRAIGKIDFFRHSALRREDYSLAALYRAVLGIILWLIRKRKEALFHLEGSQTDALATDNMVAYWTSLYGLSSLYLSEGDIERGLLFLKQAIRVAEQSGGGHQIFHSIFLRVMPPLSKPGGSCRKDGGLTNCLTVSWRTQYPCKGRGIEASCHKGDVGAIEIQLGFGGSQSKRNFVERMRRSG